MVLFPFEQYWTFYLAFSVFVLGVLALDLGVFHKNPHEVSFKESAIWTVAWISLALVFNVGFYYYSMDAVGPVLAKQSALEFLTGFVVEKALAIDNIFIFAVVFNLFAVPKIYQHRILFYGILGALLFRGVFIALGSKLMAYDAVVIFFGVLLVLTGFKMFFAASHSIDPEKNLILRLMRKVFRVTTQSPDGKFFVREHGLLHVTPLFLALVFIELSDIIFAVDSVPAIFALTKEPLIVFTSNIFAILGLRSMFFMLSGFMERFVYIKYGLAAVLIFVGLKMSWLNEAFGGKFPVTWSLGIIVLLVGSSIVASLVVSSKRRKGEVKTIRGAQPG